MRWLRVPVCLRTCVLVAREAARVLARRQRHEYELEAQIEQTQQQLAKIATMERTSTIAMF